MAPLVSAARIALLLATAFGVVNSAPSARGSTIRVKATESIQAAIDLASPGDKIVVDGGKHKEQLLIKKGITLVGRGASIVPPDVLVDNDCSGIAGTDDITGLKRQVGICVIGSGVQLGEYDGQHQKVTDIVDYVKNVEITGFEVSGFDGIDIALIGAQDARVAKNSIVTDLGGQYGILSAGSIRSVITRNTLTTSVLGFIGICSDDKSGSRVTINNITGYGIALCVQTPGADVGHNTIQNVCVGTFVDPFVVGAKITHNTISTTNPLCVPYFGAFIAGIWVDAAVNTDIKHNKISGITDGGLDNHDAAAITIYDDPNFTPTAVTSGNTVTWNTLENNDLNFILGSAGANNKIAHNKCLTGSCAP